MKWQEDAEIADEWQRKGNPGWEWNVRSCAVRDALQEAVRKPEPEGLAFLQDPGIAHQLERIIALGSVVSEDNRDAIDLALVIGRHDLARQLVPQSKPVGSAVWDEFIKAVSALLDRQPYQAPPNTKTKGWLATFVPHLALAEALSIGADLGPHIAAVDEAFAKRNRTKSMFDPGLIDGDGRLPVAWDLRKQALLAAAKKRT